MIIRSIMLAIMCLLTTLSADAQGREKVELLLIEGPMAVFSSEGFANNKKEAFENAAIAVLRKILYDGVEDFNGGYPIVSSGEGTNLWLNEFFTGKYPRYTQFISDKELIGDFENTPTGNFHCKANVVVKFNSLMEQAKLQGVTNEPGSNLQIQEPEAPRPQPQPQQQKKKKGFL
jgi:hypothetical protein